MQTTIAPSTVSLVARIVMTDTAGNLDSTLTYSTSGLSITLTDCLNGTHNYSSSASTVEAIGSLSSPATPSTGKCGFSLITRGQYLLCFRNDAALNTNSGFSSAIVETALNNSPWVGVQTSPAPAVGPTGSELLNSGTSGLGTGKITIFSGSVAAVTALGNEVLNSGTSGSGTGKITVSNNGANVTAANGATLVATAGVLGVNVNSIFNNTGNFPAGATILTAGASVLTDGTLKIGGAAAAFSIFPTFTASLVVTGTGACAGYYVPAGVSAAQIFWTRTDNAYSCGYNNDNGTYVIRAGTTPSGSWAGSGWVSASSTSAYGTYTPQTVTGSAFVADAVTSLSLNQTGQAMQSTLVAIPAATTGTNGVLIGGTASTWLGSMLGTVKADLISILGTALTETAGLIAAGFKKFFNVAAPTGTVNSLPNVVAGQTGGLALAGGSASSVAGSVLLGPTGSGYSPAGMGLPTTSAPSASDNATAVWGNASASQMAATLAAQTATLVNAIDDGSLDDHTATTTQVHALDISTLRAGDIIWPLGSQEAMLLTNANTTNGMMTLQRGYMNTPRNPLYDQEILRVVRAAPLVLDASTTIGVFPSAVLVNAPGGTGGTGANAVTLTVTDTNSAALANVKAHIYAGAVDWRQITSTSGTCRFGLDDGTYSLVLTLPGYQFTPTTLTVSSASAFTATMTATYVPAPASPTGCTVYFNVIDDDGTAVVGEQFTFIQTTPPTGSGNVYLGGTSVTATSGAGGLVTVELPQTAVWQANVGRTAAGFPIAVPAASTYQLPNVQL
jgi:hypothetical protein